MAFVVSEFIQAETGSVTQMAVEIPSHETGDLLLAFAMQDTGTGTFSTTNSANAWTDAFPQGQAAANAQRTYGWYRIATSSNEPGFVLASTLSEQTIVNIIVVRGADQTTPIDVSAIGSVAKSYAMVPPSVTTTYDGALLIYGLGTDHSTSSHYADYRDIVRINGVGTGSCAMSVGYLNQPTAGVRPNVGFANFGSQGGQAFVIAVKDDGTNRRRSSLVSAGDVVRRCGLFGQNRGDPAGDTFTDPTTIASTIAGITVDNRYTLPATTGNTNYTARWNYDPTALPGAPSSSLQGAAHVFAAPVDMSGGVFKARISFFNIRSQYFVPGSFDYLIAFADSDGNWAAFSFRGRDFGYQTGFSAHVLIDLENYPPLDSSGTVNWSSIAKMGFMFHKQGIVGGDTGSMSWQDVCILRQGTVVVRGGRNQADYRMGAELDALFDGWGGNEMASSQGAGQGVLSSCIQFCDASGNSVTQLAGASLEAPPPYSAAKTRRFRLIQVDPTPWSVKAVAGDVADFSGGLLSTDTKRDFLIDPASSPSATWNFSGAVLAGFAVVNNVSGVAINGATILGYYTSTLNGGTLSSCQLRDCKDIVGVKTNDPSKIQDCAFTQGVSGGHAIEITQPGTYTFAGNAFDGYGVDGTTDAAIYNNSGGAVTLNITGGGDTPTVRNGTGASTTIVSGVTLTIAAGVSLVGAEIRIYDLDNTPAGSLGTELAGIESCATATFTYSGSAGNSIWIQIMLPGYEEFGQQVAIPGADGDFFARLTPDTNA